VATRADITLKPAAGLTPDQVRNARSRAWRYVFDCFNRREELEGGCGTAPDEGERSSDEFASTKHLTK
jgi:hypothetical protein